jgi:hypothetical protein
MRCALKSDATTVCEEMKAASKHAAIDLYKSKKVVTLHAMEELWMRGGIAPTLS